MPRMTVISSKDNPTVKQTVKLLSSAAERARTGRFAVEGLRLCRDAAAFLPLRQFFCTDRAWETLPDAARLAERAEEVFRVSDAVFAKLSDTVSPQGVLAVFDLPPRAAGMPRKAGRYLALERMQDPANLGAVARTAEALGIDGLIVSGDGCDPFSPKAQRAAMGALVRLPVYLAPDFPAAMREQKAAGATLFAAVVRAGSERLGAVKFPVYSIVMIGNEGNGLTDQAVALADRTVTIPMAGQSESLNASVAAALFAWELTKEDADVT